MDNLARLREAMASNDLPALLVSENSSVAWVSGFSGSFGFVIVRPEDALFVTDSRYTIQAGEEVRSMPTVSFANPVTAEQFLAEQIGRLGITRLGFESQYVSYATYRKWSEKFAGVELIPAPDLFGDLRLVKSPDEVQKIRQACGIADAAFAHIQRMIQPGVTEYDLGLDLEFFIRRQGAELAFPPIVVSGERSARPHGKPSEKKLEVGDFVTMDFGAKVQGYCSDITRTVVVARADDRRREVYDQVLKAQLAAIEAIRPGVAAREVDGLARQILDEKQLARYFGHGLGHGLGKLVHDSGRLGPSSENTLAVGQVWTVEPGVYIPGFGGVRIEDDVVVTESGVEVLTTSPKEFLVLGA
jgi:Xaa-Pro aminopeptidase